MGRRGRGRGRLQQLGRGRGSRLGLGRRGGALIHRIEINGPNSLSHLSSRPQRKKCQKIYCFPEECLLKLQTPMPQNMKEKRNRNLTSFPKIGVSHSTPLKKNSSSNSTTSKQSIQGTSYSTTIQNMGPLLVLINTRTSTSD
jgi:hypothetical protein